MMAFYIYACYIYTKDLYNRYIKILSVTFFSCPNIFNQINILPRKKNITNNLHKTTISPFFIILYQNIRLTNT